MTSRVFDSETLAKGLQVIVACAFIHHNFNGIEKVFLAKRADSKKFYPGVYEIAGGHIDFGEDIVEGLKREIHEELGKDINVGDPFSVFTYINEVKGAHSIEVAYFAQFSGKFDDIKLDPADHSECGWFAADEESKYLVNRLPNDPEIDVIRRGFALLKGKNLEF